MKEHVQKTGVRKYAGDDLIELQAEPLKVIQAFFKKCGDCVINGCEVVPAGNKYNVASGIVSIRGTDADGAQAAKVVPFGGVEDVTLPIYLTLANTVSERVYGDGKVKPIAYNYTAVAAGVKPANGVPFLEITTAGGKQFVDAIKVTGKLDKIGNGKDVTVTFAEAAERVNVSSGEKLSWLWGKVQKWFAGLKTVAFTGKAADLTQDANNRLVTDTEKANWADKYTRTEVDNKDATVLQSAKEHANGVVNTLSGDVYRKAQTDSKDAATLQAAKEYAAAKVAEIVNSSPGTLDTLSELAAALGNDPNFATSIMTLIAGKANSVHNHTIANVTNLQSELDSKLDKNVTTYAPVGATYLSSDDSITGVKIRLPFSMESGKMACFTVRMYSGYNAYDVQFSGYLYMITKNWYNPKASTISITTPIVVKMGVDADGIAYVWLRGGEWTGVSVLDIVGCFKVADWNSGWEIIRTDSCPNITFEKTLYPNANENQLDLKANTNHNHDAAYAPKTHTHNYEPAFSKNTAFNKNFGTTAGTVAQGNHTHPGVMIAKIVGEVYHTGGIVTSKGVVFNCEKSGTSTYTVIYNNTIADSIVMVTGGKGSNGSHTYASLMSKSNSGFVVATADDITGLPGGFHFVVYTIS